ncbi:MAG: ATP-grasp domain-containing protein [Patescibacteria group bacterium]
MYHVLISAVGGDIGQGILKSLRASKLPLKIIGCDMNPDSAGIFLCDKGYLVTAARSDPQKYIKDIVKICKQEHIEIVFCAQPYELKVLSRFKKKIKLKTGAYVAVQDQEIFNLSMDKLKIYNFMKSKLIRSPETYADQKGFEILAKKHGYPLLVKARLSFGFGFHDFKLVNNREEFKKIWQSSKGLIVQEYIENQDNEEYTVGVFLDKYSKVLGSIAMLRKLRFGLTFHAVADDYTAVRKAAEKAAQSIGAVGPCNVQLRIDKKGNPCVIEINARISSTTAFRTHFGFNEAKACIEYFLQNKIPKFSYKKGVAMKAWTEAYTTLSKYNLLKKKRIL